MNLSTPPKGSLEDLFRHHLLESEAAIAPPRPQVWEQLDNSLLVAQNEKYRQRLRVHRWAIAASLLLAMLSGGGWWHSQQQPTIPLAQATSTGTNALGTAAQPNTGRPGFNNASQPTNSQATGTLQATSVAGTSSPSTALSIAQPVTSLPDNSFAATKAHGTGSGRSRSLVLAAAGHSYALAGRRHTARAKAASESATAHGVHHSALTESGLGNTAPSTAVAYGNATSSAKAGQSAWVPAGRTTGQPAESVAMSFKEKTTATSGEQSSLANVASSESAALDAQQVAAAEALATRQAQLALATAQALPATLAALDLPAGPAPTVARRWQFGLAFATSTFQPNIDFAREPSDYNPALGAKSATLTRTAAAEYRNNLHAGLGGRLSLWATRRLGNGRFGLRMGLEVAQNTASSASSMAFVGEQVPDLSYTMPAQPSQLQATSYRYRSASVPVELRYGNSAKSGFSFYSHIGGLLTALLNVRSEVEGNAEATRTYTFVSASSPYRRLSASVRGGAGMQYRPSGHQWALSLGPIAEASVLSLNADPTQGFWSQKRPYSFGLEAGVELGRSPRLLIK